MENIRKRKADLVSGFNLLKPVVLKHSFDIYKILFSTLKVVDLKAILTRIQGSTIGKRGLLEERLAEFFANGDVNDDLFIHHHNDIQLLLEASTNRTIKNAVKNNIQVDLIEVDEVDAIISKRVCFV